MHENGNSFEEEKNYRSRCGKVRPTYWMENVKGNLRKGKVKRLRSNEIENNILPRTHKLCYLWPNAKFFPKNADFPPKEKQKWWTTVENCRWKSEISAWKTILMLLKWQVKHLLASSEGFYADLLKKLLTLPEFHFQWPFQGRLKRLIPYNSKKNWRKFKLLSTLATRFVNLRTLHD